MVTQEEALELIKTGYDLAKLQTMTWEEIESTFRDHFVMKANLVSNTGQENGAEVGIPASSPIHANFEQMGGKLVVLGSQAGKSDSS
jgi:hypothetical protein